MTKKPQCIQCKLNITDKRKPGIGCDNCDNATHFTCAKLAKDTFYDIGSGKAAWTCKTCVLKKKNRRSSIFPAAATANSSSSQLEQPSTSAQATDKLFNDLITDFNEFKRITNDRIAHLEAVCAVKTQQIASLTSTVEFVEAKAEQTAREVAESSLEVQGIPDNYLLDPTRATIAVAADIGCELTPDEVICEVSRSGSKAVIVINFISKIKRQTFLHAGKKFNRDRKRIHRDGTEHKIFINERLTSVQKKLLYNTKSFARDFGFQFTWFCNGQVHLKKSDLSRLIIVKSQSQLEGLQQHEASLLLPERERTANENGFDVPINQE